MKKNPCRYIQTIAPCSAYSKEEQETCEYYEPRTVLSKDHPDYSPVADDSARIEQFRL